MSDMEIYHQSTPEEFQHSDIVSPQDVLRDGIQRLEECPSSGLTAETRARYFTTAVIAWTRREYFRRIIGNSAKARWLAWFREMADPMAIPITAKNKPKYLVSGTG